MILLARSIAYPGEVRMLSIAAKLSIARIPYKHQLMPGGRYSQIIVSDKNAKKARLAIGAI